MKQFKRIMSLFLCLSLMLSVLAIPANVKAASKCKLSKKSLTMNVGSSTLLTLKQGKKKITSAKWKTSNKKVATVKKGKVTAKKAGNAKITATYKKKKYVCNVVVKEKTETKTTDTNTNMNTNTTNTNTNTNTDNNSNQTPEPTYAISQTTASVEVEKTLKLEVTKNDSNATTSATWSSSDSSIVTVSYGTITAKAPGSTVITAHIDGKDLQCKVTVTAPNYTISKTSASIKTAKNENTVQLNLLNGSAKASDVVWTSGDENIATVSEDGFVTGQGDGKTTITGTKYGKKYTCDVTVDGFVFRRDVKIEYDYKDVYVNFDVKKTNGQIDPEEKAELEELGFEISSDGKASKNQQCETAKYTFTKLPNTVKEIESFFEDPEQGDTIDIQKEGQTGNYGGFNAMAATICATNVDTWLPNPADPHFSKHPVREMFEYINGPTLTIAETAQTQGIESMKSAVQACGENVYKAYFKGATADNNYTPDSPYVLEMYKGPYYIPEKQTINGKRPTTYMILVSSECFDSDRYIDVYYSTKAKRWFSYENQFQHITANNFISPEPEL